MSAAEKIRNLLREKPRAVSELAQAVYGTSYGTARSQVHNRLKYMIAKGQVRAERTGEASNALVMYHWAGELEATATAQADLLEELESQLPIVQDQLQTLAQTVRQLRRCFHRGHVSSSNS